MKTPILGRDIDAVADRKFDVVVVGGGIHGILLGLQSARRGLATLLVERGDFGSGTSASTLRILHGGLRYLQTLDMPRYRSSVAERAWFLRTFPDLTCSVPFLLALDGSGLRRPGVLRVALEMNDRASATANRQIPEQHRWGPGRVLDRAATRRALPAFEDVPLVGGALWHDGLVRSPARLHVEALRWMCSFGSKALNYTEAVSVRSERGAIDAVLLRDIPSGREWSVSTDRVFNCAGPWVDALASSWDARAPRLSYPSFAFNLVAHRPLTPPGGFGVRGRHGKSFFFWTAGEQTHIGTSHHSLRELGIPEETDEVSRVMEDTAVHVRVAEAFLQEFHASIPGLGLDESDISAIHGGILPAVKAGSAVTSERDRIFHHAARGGPIGLFSISGIKYTTANAVAERALRAAFGTKLPGLRPDPRPHARDLLTVPELRALIERHPEDAEEQVRRLVEDEAVVELDDLLLRRLEGPHERTEVEEVAAWVVSRLAWSPEAASRARARLRTGLDQRVPWTANSSRDVRAASK